MGDPAVDDVRGGHSPRTARRQASILGTIPDSRVGSSLARSSALISEIRLVVSGQLA